MWGELCTFVSLQQPIAGKSIQGDAWIPIIVKPPATTSSFDPPPTFNQSLESLAPWEAQLFPELLLFKSNCLNHF
jgi:hypothetical protein